MPAASWMILPCRRIIGADLAAKGYQSGPYHRQGRCHRPAGRPACHGQRQRHVAGRAAVACPDRGEAERHHQGRHQPGLLEIAAGRRSRQPDAACRHPGRQPAHRSRPPGRSASRFWAGRSPARPMPRSIPTTRRPSWPSRAGCRAARDRRHRQSGAECHGDRSDRHPTDRWHLHRRWRLGRLRQIRLRARHRQRPARRNRRSPSPPMPRRWRAVRPN